MRPDLAVARGRATLVHASVACGLLWAASAASALTTLVPCRLKGVEHEARCGSVTRPLDPARPQGPQVEVHFAVLPALAQRNTADPVFFFAGGPGQSAMTLAGPLSQQFARLNNRRDLVFVDQRGTGRSAPLKCPEDVERQPPQPLALLLDQARQLERLAACRRGLQQLPHGDLRQYTTSIAVADVDAVREALGAAQVNAIGF
jgi:pimeloyl-ACP methyl ester carboxylesterase